MRILTGSFMLLDGESSWRRPFAERDPGSPVRNPSTTNPTFAILEPWSEPPEV